MSEKHIEIDTIREQFNTYQVENGQILKAKQILTDFIEREVKKKGVTANAGFQHVSHVITPEKIDTSDFELLPAEQVTDEHVIKELKFKPVKEIINIYETEKLIILVDSKVEKIMLTNKKDKSENPILRYRSGVFLSVIPKDVPDEEKIKLKPT